MKVHILAWLPEMIRFVITHLTFWHTTIGMRSVCQRASLKALARYIVAHLQDFPLFGSYMTHC